MSDDIDKKVVEETLFEFIRNNTVTVYHLLRDNEDTRNLTKILESKELMEEYDKLDIKNKQLVSYLLQIIEFDGEYLNSIKFMGNLK